MHKDADFALALFSVTALNVARIVKEFINPGASD